MQDENRYISLSPEKRRDDFKTKIIVSLKAKILLEFEYFCVKLQKIFQSIPELRL